MSRNAWLIWILGLALAVLTVFWSYLFADPNFLLVTHPVYVEFQRAALAISSSVWWRAPLYLILIVAWFTWYAVWLKLLPQLHLKQKVFTWIVILGVLLLGHNALSHDIFNYIFNAKMVLTYGADPHVKTALDFAMDPWTRFMHNIHTPAPYGWGWTLLSLLPVWVGKGIFALTYFFTKAWIAFGLVLCVGFLSKLEERVRGTQERVWQFAWHPLVIFEVLLSSHNDVWMMWPVLAALLLVVGTPLRWQVIGRYILASLLFAFSIWQKYVTVVLLFIPPLISEWKLPWQSIQLWKARLAVYWPDLAALALLAPLLTARSQQFHPWYLVWALCFWPLLTTRWLRFVFLGLSISSLLRYMPWLESNLQYTPVILALQKSITASGALLGLFWWLKTKNRYPKR